MNMDELVHRYHKDVYVVEYSAKKEEIHKMDLNYPMAKAKAPVSGNHSLPGR